MKNHIKKQPSVFLFILLLIIYITPCFSQMNTDMIKYWYYRNRLYNYFAIPGEKVGESQITCTSNIY